MPDECHAFSLSSPATIHYYCLGDFLCSVFLQDCERSKTASVVLTQLFSCLRSLLFAAWICSPHRVGPFGDLNSHHRDCLTLLSVTCPTHRGWHSHGPHSFTWQSTTFTKTYSSTSTVSAHRAWFCI